MHEMLHTETDDSGAERWVCFDCGREMLMRWPPNYEKLILVRGDENVSHTGGKGGVSISGVNVNGWVA